MFQGSLVAIVTPMFADGSIDYDSFSNLLDWHIENQTDGVVVLGTTGESATVESSEREKLIRLAVSRLKGRLPVIVGTGANATSHALALTEEAAHLGADAALLVTPYYNKPTQEGLFLHFQKIAKAVSIPQILYNVPSRTACDLLPNTVKRLSALTNIVGIKDATGDLERLKALKALDMKMDLLSGDDGSALEFMLLGGQGVISVVANIAPFLTHQLCEAALSDNVDAAKKINEQLAPLYKSLFAESNPIPTKWALEKMGFIQSGIRLPLTALSAACYGQVESAMRHAQLIS